jgi:transcriptional regulator with XRE-family HTH domain
MIQDKMGRWIRDKELLEFSRLGIHERLKWVREELNKIYIGEYSVKKVATNSGKISHRGLYNLEDNLDTKPRSATLEALAEYYQVPVSIFSASTVEDFYLGKQVTESKNADIRTAHHELEIQFILRSPEGKKIEEVNISSKARYMDAEELLSRLKDEVKIIQLRLEKQKRMDEAYDLLTKKQ